MNHLLQDLISRLLHCSDRNGCQPDVITVRRLRRPSWYVWIIIKATGSLRNMMLNIPSDRHIGQRERRVRMAERRGHCTNQSNTINKCIQKKYYNPTLSNASDVSCVYRLFRHMLVFVLVYHPFALRVGIKGNKCLPYHTKRKSLYALPMEKMDDLVMKNENLDESTIKSVRLPLQYRTVKSYVLFHWHQRKKCLLR